MSKWAQAREWVDDSVPKAEIARRLKWGEQRCMHILKQLWIS